MTIGDPGYWDDFFSRELIPTVLDLVIETWGSVGKLAPDEYEDKTSRRLYSAMVKGKHRQKVPFLIRYQDVALLKSSMGKRQGA
jgi:hypothetical protein